MRSVIKSLGVLAAVLALGGAAAAQAPAKAATVTVTAKPKPSPTPNHQAADFVDTITLQPAGESLIRWGEPICPLAVGLDPAQNAAIAQQIALIAHRAGAPVAQEACHPNFVVVATSQPDALLAAWRKRDPGMFGDAWPSDISQFLTKARPVRVWYNALRTTTDGEPIMSEQNGGNPVVSSFVLSRLRFETVLGLQSAIVVVDLKQTEGFTIGQISAYAALIGLTELKLDADFANAPSILRLFAAAAAERPDGLTDWDQGLLAGVYQTDQASRLQRSAIAAKVVTAVTGAPPPNP
jgi:hypothetical protein